MDPSWDSSEKSGFAQPAPPPYQENQGYPNAGYPPQQYGTPGGQPIPQAQYPGQPPITVQPTVYVSLTPLANPLPDYLGYSIFTMLCCCLPLGIAALINSMSTRNANMSGQQQVAEKSSRLARKLNHTALGLGITFLVIYIILVVFYLRRHARD